MENKIGKKQNKLRWDGKKYVAVPADAGCFGCTFIHSPCPKFDGVVGYCTGSQRTDKAAIIWKERVQKC